MLFGRRSSSSPTENGHECVDLGLSVRWATCNIGASSPEQRGDYFAWGETRTKSRYYWDTYNLCRGSQYTLTEYNTDSCCGRVDNRTMLSGGYDVAKVKWGGRWRMPTPKECAELVNQCHWEKWKGTRGGEPAIIKLTGPNGNSILLPTTGEQCEEALTYPNDNGNIGLYWSNSIDPARPSSGILITFDYYYLSYQVGRSYRCFGVNVRAVCS